jgi:hypothetical protein
LATMPAVCHFGLGCEAYRIPGKFMPKPGP